MIMRTEFGRAPAKTNDAPIGSDSNLRGTFSQAGWTPPQRMMTPEDAAREVDLIERIGVASRWAMGDMLNTYEEWFGEHYTQFFTRHEPEYYRGLKWLAKRFPASDRFLDLGVYHHQAVAALPPPQRRDLLEQARRKQWPSAVLREKVAEFKAARSAGTTEETPTFNLDDPELLDATAELATAKPEDIKIANEIRVRAIDTKKTEHCERTAEKQAANAVLPQNRYNIILAQPSWEEDNSPKGPTLHSIKQRCPTMTEAELSALHVESMAADDAVLFMYARPGKMDAALRVMARWGFKYSAEWIVIYDESRMSYFGRSMHEIMLIGKRGDLPPPNLNKEFLTVFEFAPRNVRRRAPSCVSALIRCIPSWPTRPN